MVMIVVLSMGNSCDDYKSQVSCNHSLARKNVCRHQKQVLSSRVVVCLQAVSLVTMLSLEY